MKAAITILVFCVAALLALGMVMLYSSSMVRSGAHFLALQFAWAALGLAACFIAALMDYRHLKKIAWPLFGIAILLLVMVLIPHVGAKINGAKRWLRFGGFTLQPSEFAKVALIIVLARYGEIHLRQMGTWKRGVLIPGCFIIGVLGLIFLEPDVGNALLLASVSGVVLLTAGIRLRYFLPPVIAAALAVGIFIYNNPMRSERVYSWLHVEETKRAKGLQAYEGMIAFGAGGWTGLGLANGRQKLGFVPEHHTDFIFPMIGEELGLIATLSVVAAFIAIVVCGIFIATRAHDTFGLLLATGVTFLIGLQAFINIAVVTGVLPNKGLPLPFISYGGSNLLMMLVCIGILLSVARRAKMPEPVNRNPFAEELPEAQAS